MNKATVVQAADKGTPKLGTISVTSIASRAHKKEGENRTR